MRAGPQVAAADATLRPGDALRLADVVAVTKPRIISLLVFVGATSAVAAAHGLPPFLPFTGVVAGGGLAAAGANALNCALDRDVDGLMHRTRQRPLPAGRLSTEAVLALGAGLLGAAFAVLGLCANLLAACLALAGGVWYVAVYTFWLKRRTVENIVIGGAAGAFPAVVGWRHPPPPPRRGRRRQPRRRVRPRPPPADRKSHAPDVREERNR